MEDVAPTKFMLTHILFLFYFILEYKDDQIMDALSDVSMIEVVEQLPYRLDTTVADGGLNFSVGQRQLLCLARGTLFLLLSSSIPCHLCVSMMLMLN